MVPVEFFNHANLLPTGPSRSKMTAPSRSASAKMPSTHPGNSFASLSLTKSTNRHRILMNSPRVSAIRFCSCVPRFSRTGDAWPFVMSFLLCSRRRAVPRLDIAVGAELCDLDGSVAMDLDDPLLYEVLEDHPIVCGRRERLRVAQ